MADTHSLCSPVYSPSTPIYEPGMEVQSSRKNDEEMEDLEAYAKDSPPDIKPNTAELGVVEVTSDESTADDDDLIVDKVFPLTSEQKKRKRQNSAGGFNYIKNNPKAKQKMARVDIRDHQEHTQFRIKESMAGPSRNLAEASESIAGPSALHDTPSDSSHAVPSPRKKKNKLSDVEACVQGTVKYIGQVVNDMNKIIEFEGERLNKNNSSSGTKDKSKLNKNNSSSGTKDKSKKDKGK